MTTSARPVHVGVPGSQLPVRDVARAARPAEDARRRRLAQLAQAPLRMSGGRLMPGLGGGELAGTVPYGIAYDRPVGRFAHALAVIHALFSSGGRTVLHEGRGTFSTQGGY